MSIGWFVFGLIVAFGICGMADTKALRLGKVKMKGKWYKLVPLSQNKVDN